MEVATISGVVDALLGKLNSLILKEVCLAWNCEKDIRKLKSTLSTIQAVLRNAEKLEAQSDEVINWLAKLKNAACDADDLLEESAAESSMRKQSTEVCNYPLLPCQFIFHHRLGHKIKKITEELDDIAKERSMFHLKDGTVDEGVEGRDRRLQTHSFLDESEVYGREDDKRKLLEQLISEDSFEEKCLVIPIVGMGGIGKTTVAQLVYNDEKVTAHFQLKMWVWVSEHLHERRILQEIMESASSGEHDCGRLSLDLMINDLRAILCNKRFLLVLDDVWSENHEMWDRFRKVFLNFGCKGSRIIVTTRSEKVASILGTVQPYYLNVLSDNECWELFKERAFTFRRNGCPTFEAIGRNIVRKCGGVPLAAKALGSMMRFKREENQWRSVEESEIWNLPEHENAILPAFRLSYNHLPSHLKQCFAYCAIFPKGYEFDKHTLISLWLANGFIPSKRKLTLEDSADDVVDELMFRSLLQRLQLNEDGEVVKFRMHCLTHDLAQYIMRKECAIIRADQNDSVNEEIRHVTCDVRPLLAAPSGLPKAKALRTFLLLSNRATYISCRFDPENINFRFLRVLGLSHTSIKKLPISTTNVKLLRYLDLSYTPIHTLPESLSKLPNLQTLLLKCCRSLRVLPRMLSKITSLRYLNISGCDLLTHMPSHIGKLTSLQRLTDFVIGRVDSSIVELKELKLSGELHIKQLENVRFSVDALESSLMSKTNLQVLALSWKEDHATNLEENNEEVLEALQPSWKLKSLHLENYKGVRFPEWVQSSS